MKGWKPFKLEEVCKKISSGGTPLTSKREYYENGTIPWLKTTEVNKEIIRKIDTYITEEGLKNSSAKLIPANSIIVAMYGDGGTAGKAALTKMSLCTNQACCNLIIDEKIADYSFIYYYLKVNYENLVNLKSGGSQQNLNALTIRKFPILIPPLPTQHRIASILSAYDELIENNMQRIKLLEQMAEEIYKKWFLRLQFPGCESITFINGLPKGWNIESFGKYIFFQEGPGLRKWQWTTFGIKVINVTNIIGDGSVDVNNTDRFISIDEFKKTYSHFEISENDIVIASSGNTYGKVGKILSIHLPLLMNTSVIRFNTKDSKVLPNSYLQAFLFSREMKDQIEQFVIGSAQPNFGPSHIQKMKILLPEQNILEKFDRLLSPMFSEIDLLRAKNPLLQQTRDLLLPRLISGKLSVEHLPNIEDSFN